MRNEGLRFRDEGLGCRVEGWTIHWGLEGFIGYIVSVYGVPD